MLAEAGFDDVEVQPLFRYRSVRSGRKPPRRTWVMVRV
jgi:hypothetical protein